MHNQKISIEKITELAKFYQNHVYPTGAHPIQIKETEQAYLAGFYEALQVVRQIKPEMFYTIEIELRTWFDERIKELKK